MTIEDKQNELIEQFNQFEDWMDKYSMLIEMGKELPGIALEAKTKQNLISGCQSRVWLTADYENGKIRFSADSDAVITKGIISLLIKVLSGHTPDEILDTNMDFVDKIGLREHLSPTRSNGLTSMIKQMKLYALVFKTKYSQNQE